MIYDDDYEEFNDERFYDNNSWCDCDYYEEPYSREDSLMDALDGVPDAYWNID